VYRFRYILLEFDKSGREILDAYRTHAVAIRAQWDRIHRR